MNLPSLIFTFLSIGLLVNADDYPRLDDQICPKSAWISVGDGFRYEQSHSTFIIPQKTPAYDHVFHYVYSHALNFGQTLYFSGTAKLRTTNEFEINIIATSDVNSDDAVRILHIKHLHWNALAYNTYENGWGSEEKTIPSPIKKGEPFNLQIRVAPEAFEISVNGKHVHTYKHRLPPNIMGFIRIVGDVTLTRARVAGRQFEVPYKVTLPSSGLELGDHVVVVGAVTKGDFNINFLNIIDNIVVQFNVRIRSKAIDCNTFTDGKQSYSQRGVGFPIEAGREFEFDFMILPDKSGVAVHIDGVFYQTFKHDMQAESSKDEFYYFQITGDVDFRALEVCPHK
uniref:Galectin n=1 Tax=Panagrellus redivivus TaxID=6233 RepID=A0A7E4VWX8_PANRE